jgi:hypothetical protein
MLAVEAGGSETIANKERKERRARLFLDFVFCSPGTADSVFYQPLGVLKTPKRQRKREGGGEGVRVWNMLEFSSCSQNKCVRACVCMFSFSKILLKFFPLIFIE